MHFTHSPFGLCCEAHLLCTLSVYLPARIPKGSGMILNQFKAPPLVLSLWIMVCLLFSWMYNLSVCHPALLC